jgi:WXXGXW repeat (2 copies)
MINPMKPYTLQEIPSTARRTLIRAAGATALLSALAFASGCVVAVRPAPVVYSEPAPGPGYAEPQEVVVDTAPPPPLTEYIGVAPGPGYLWIGGYYHWSGARWVWNRGHYSLPPRPGQRWIGARYEVRGGRRVYIRGYWR